MTSGWDQFSPDYFLNLSISCVLRIFIFSYFISSEKEVEVLKTLLRFTPGDPQALRLAVQAAGFSNNKEFGEYAISLMEIHNPGAVSLAKGFLESALNQSNK